MLLEQVWGYRHAADTRLVNVHVQRLRSKIERDPEHPEIVVTVRGIGYKAGETDSPREPQSPHGWLGPTVATPRPAPEVSSRWWRLRSAWWWRSLPLRVVLTVFVASVLVLVLGGFLLMQQATVGRGRGQEGERRATRRGRPSTPRSSS